VDLRLGERLEVSANGQARHLAVRPTFLGERDQERRRLTDDLDPGGERLNGSGIRTRSDRSRGGEHSDTAERGRRDRSSGDRFDHTQDGKVELDAQTIWGDRAYRVARDDDCLYISRDQMTRARESVAGDRRGTARSVRHACRVTEVDDVFVGEHFTK